jgi:hypothetical protein
MPKSGQSRQENFKNIVMTIKLKNKKEEYVTPTTVYYETQCDWCAKTIKVGKQKFLQSGWLNGTCSMAHAKAILNSKI